MCLRYDIKAVISHLGTKVVLTLGEGDSGVGFSPNNWVLYSLSLSMDMIYKLMRWAWPGVFLSCSS